MKPYQIALSTFVLTLISVVLVARMVNQPSNENWQSIVYSPKTLEKILTANNFDKFEISAYLSAVDPDGNKIMIDLSKDPTASDEQIEINEPGISEHIDRELFALFAVQRCVSTADVYIHPGITPPGNTCYKVGMYGPLTISGKYIERHCHCFNPSF